jgi:hypothetical protein
LHLLVKSFSSLATITAAAAAATTTRRRKRRSCQQMYDAHRNTNFCSKISR